MAPQNDDKYMTENCFEIYITPAIKWKRHLILRNMQTNCSLRIIGKHYETFKIIINNFCLHTTHKVKRSTVLLQLTGCDFRDNVFINLFSKKQLLKCSDLFILFPI